MAREVLNSHITKKATIFSLGLSVFQIATDLYLPSSGQRWHDIRDLNIDPKFTQRKILTYFILKFQLFSGLTPDLVSLIYRMIATDPLERPSTSEILDSPLLREHNSGYRQWNRTLYPLFRNLSKIHFPTFGGSQC